MKMLRAVNSIHLNALNCGTILKMIRAKPTFIFTSLSALFASFGFDDFKIFSKDIVGSAVCMLDTIIFETTSFSAALLFRFHFVYVLFYFIFFCKVFYIRSE